MKNAHLNLKLKSIQHNTLMTKSIQIAQILLQAICTNTICALVSNLYVRLTSYLVRMDMNIAQSILVNAFLNMLKRRFIVLLSF